jgi:hypothetical protein
MLSDASSNTVSDSSSPNDEYDNSDVSYGICIRSIYLGTGKWLTRLVVWKPPVLRIGWGPALSNNRANRSPKLSKEIADPLGSVG